MSTSKKQIVFFSMDDKNPGIEYWRHKSPLERIYALEILRNQYLTDSNGTRQRLQRVFGFAPKV